MPKLRNQEIVDNFTFCGITFPPVLVDQTNFRISEVIRRNKAGEQVLGDTHLQFDYMSTDKNPDYDKVNPFIDLGFDLDDIIRVAKDNSVQVTQLQNRLGEIKQKLDQAKQVEQTEQKTSATQVVAPADPKKD